MASDYEPIEYGLGEVKELFDSCIVVGTITEVKHDTNKANVETEKWGIISDIPIHYHCPDTETVDDGHLAFADDDQVYLLHDGSGLPPSASTLKIVGRVEGLKECRGYLIAIRISDEVIVWEFKKNELFILLDEDGNEISQPCTWSQLKLAVNVKGDWYALGPSGQDWAGGRADTSSCPYGVDTCDPALWPPCDCPCSYSHSASDNKSKPNPGISGMPDSVSLCTSFYESTCVQPGRDFETQISNMMEFKTGCGSSVEGTSPACFGKLIKYCKLPMPSASKHYSWFWLEQHGTSDGYLSWPGQTGFSQCEHDVYFHSAKTGLQIVDSNSDYYSELRADGSSSAISCRGGGIYSVIGDHCARSSLLVGLETFLGSAIFFEAVQTEFKEYFYENHILVNYISKKEGQMNIFRQVDRHCSDPGAGEAGYDYEWDAFTCLDMVSILGHFTNPEENFAYAFVFRLK